MGIKTQCCTENSGWKVGVIQKIFDNFDNFCCIIFWTQTVLILPE